MVFAGILEQRRALIKDSSILTEKDENALFAISNKFARRHRNVSQQRDYDPAFLDWIFWWRLATVALTNSIPRNVNRPRVGLRAGAILPLPMPTWSPRQAAGKAASLYWNVNANFQLTIAERGELSYAGHPRNHPGAPHTEDLDFDDFRHRNAKGLTVLARVAGRGITAADVAAIHAADRAYILEK